jgi:hypothetical protein
MPLQAASGYEGWPLTGYELAVTTAKSVVIGTSLIEGDITAKEARGTFLATSIRRRRQVASAATIFKIWRHPFLVRPRLFVRSSRDYGDT